MRIARNVHLHHLDWRVTLMTAGWLGRRLGAFNGIEFEHDIVRRRAHLSGRDTPTVDAFTRMSGEELERLMTTAEDL